MFTYPKFDVELVRDVDPETLGWPEPGEAQDESGLGGNRAYVDLRRLSWGEADRVAVLEGELITRIESAADPQAEYEAIENELFESDVGLYGLDLGIAAAVVSLSAAGCVPCASCNAGTFGDDHHESYPLVVFYARAEAVEPLLTAAEEAEIGLAGCWFVVAYADDVRKLMRFASCLRARSGLFRGVRKPKTSKPEPKPEPDPGQFRLDLGP